MKPKRHHGLKTSSFLLTPGKGKSFETFPAGAVVFSQGDSDDAVFFIRSGKVKLVVTSESGKDAVLGIRVPGEFFGESDMDEDRPRLKTVTALTECTALRIEKAVMRRQLCEDPTFAQQFIAYLLDRYTRAEETLAYHMFNSSEQRLARTLLLLANSGDGPEEMTVDKISHETLAEMVGTTRSRISFFMNRFRKMGYIAYKGRTHGTVRVRPLLLMGMLRDDVPAGH